MKPGLAFVVLLAVWGCEGKRSLGDTPTADELPGLVAKYETFITQAAEVVKTGDCEAKWSALAPLFVMHAATDERMRRAMSEPAQRDEMQRLIEARGPKISDPEIAFKQAKLDCAGKGGFPAQ